MAKDKVKLEIPSLDKTEREFYVTVVSNGKKTWRHDCHERWYTVVLLSIEKSEESGVEEVRSACHRI